MTHDEATEQNERQRIGQKRRRGPEGAGEPGSEEESEASERRGRAPGHRDESALGLGPRKRMYAAFQTIIILPILTVFKTPL
jgi:hypothetical protein